jgi:hypothetical protein
MAYSESERQRIVDEICDKIANGASLRSALDSGEYPARKNFLEWIDQDESKRNQYARAMEIRAEVKFDSIEQDYMERPKIDPETGRIDPAWVNLQRLKIDAKKWELSKLFPRKYGDKQETTHIFEKPIFNGIDLDVPTDNGSK